MVYNFIISNEIAVKIFLWGMSFILLRHSQLRRLHLLHREHIFSLLGVTGYNLKLTLKVYPRDTCLWNLRAVNLNMAAKSTPSYNFCFKKLPQQITSGCMQSDFIRNPKVSSSPTARGSYTFHWLKIIGTSFLKIAFNYWTPGKERKASGRAPGKRRKKEKRNREREDKVYFPEYSTRSLNGLLYLCDNLVIVGPT